MLATDNEEQRESVLQRTGIQLMKLPFKPTYALAQTATASPNWVQYKSRCCLTLRHLREQLKAVGSKPVAELLGQTDGGCMFAYGQEDYCVPHKDKSEFDLRWMARLTEKPDTTHNLMIQGVDRVVYNIEMKGPMVYRGGHDGTILFKQCHAVPKPKEGSSRLVTMLLTITDTASDFETKFNQVLPSMNTIEKDWVSFDTTGNRKGRYEHITKSQCRQGGNATIASHGEQLGNGGRKGGLATIPSHGEQMGNGGRCTIASHGEQMGNCGRKSVTRFP